MRKKVLIKKELKEKEKIGETKCEFSSKYPHEHACYNDCYFTDKAFVYVESEPEDTDNEDENNTESDEYSETAEQHQNSDSDTVTCQQCTFKAKNKSGLKIHLKYEHKFLCNHCDYRTTTQIQLKKHTTQEHK